MKKGLSRRSFIKKSALTTGVAAMSPLALSAKNEKLPREVWIAALSQMDMRTSTPEEMLQEIAGIAEKALVLAPDVLCLPETFVVANQNKPLDLSEKIVYSNRALEAFSDIARRFHCNIICSGYTSENGKAYNSAVFLNREGSQIGEYRKMHLTVEEIESGLTPGPVDPPVFKTDFGIAGAQICYDMYWDDGWSRLAEKGAEIVFWPSAFAGGERVNMKALAHHYAVVSSTRKNTSKICDLTGRVISETGFWNQNFFYGKINLERILVDTWPHFTHFNEIQKKYGKAINITTLHEEQFSVIESLSADIKVADILLEFGIRPYKDEIKEAEIAQIKARE